MRLFSSNKRSRASVWGLSAVVVSVAGLAGFLFHKSRRHSKKIYLSGSIIGLAVAGSLALSVSGGTDVLVIPRSADNSVKMAAASPELFSVLWFPFKVCYPESTCLYNSSTYVPVGWPNDLTDSNIIKNIGAKAVVWGALGMYYPGSQADPAIVALLDWAQSVGMKVSLDDETSWYYINRGYYGLSTLEAHIKRLVELYGSHPGLNGWYTGNEPEGWGASALDKEGMYARYGEIMALYKKYDTNVNHHIYSSTATAAKLRFCREGQPTHLHNSGFGTLRDANPLVDEDSQEYQNMIDRTIYNFDEDYLCTENYNIPFNYSLAANYWQGDVVTSAETNMYSYLLLAHGGRGIEWFVYSTDGGLVWDNQAPTYSQNFSSWLPSMHGGLIYLDSKYRSPVGFSNVILSNDSSIMHSGNYSARMDFSGPVNNYYNLRLNPPQDSKYPWSFNFPRLKVNTSYTIKSWIKISGDALVQFSASGPNVRPYTTVSGPTDWVEVTTTFTTPATAGKWSFGPLIATASNGSVWFDDFSLVETNDLSQRNLVAKFNPGFESSTGADRTPHEPLYSAVRQVNSDFASLNIFAQLKHLISFDDQHAPTAGLVTALSASGVTRGLARAEAGLFTTSDINGNYYLVVVNRNINSSEQISLTLHSPNAVTFNDLISGSSQVYPSSGGVVPVSFSLPPGGGKAFRLQGVTYQAPTFTSAYQEDFESGTASGWTTRGGPWTVVDDNGSKVYDVTATTDALGIQTSVDVADFEYSGKFRIMPDHNSTSVLHFSFRKLASNPSMDAGSYSFRVQVDPGAENSTGYIQLVRWSQNSAVICQVNDENFLRGDRYINFKIRAIGNVFESWFDGVKYTTCVDNSPEAYTSGQVGFRIYPGGHVRLDELSVKSLDAATIGCNESWSCTDWSLCSDSAQSRLCVDLNACGTINDRPALSQACVMPTCTEDWTCSDWSVCSNGQQTKSCTDNNSCGTTVHQPATTQTCSSGTGGGGGGGGGTPPTCNEKWSCTDWISCSNGAQTRACFDVNSCGTISLKPETTQSCKANCTSNYNCGDWSGCRADNTQTRLCTDANSCSQESTRTETRECLGTVRDSTPPTTVINGLKSPVTADHLSVTFSGSDNKSAVSALKYEYQLDSQPVTANTGTALTLKHLTNGSHVLKAWALDEAGNKDQSPAQVTFTVNVSLYVVTIPKSDALSLIRVFDNQGKLVSQFNPFSGFRRTGGSVALGDVDHNGTNEIISAPGRGGKPQVAWYDLHGKKLGSFMAYPTNFIGGVNVALADLNGDGANEIITAPATGTGPLVRVFKPSGELIAETAAFDRLFRGGVNITAGSVDNSGKSYIFAAPASNGSGEIVKLELQDKTLAKVAAGSGVTGTRTVGLSLALGQIDNSNTKQLLATVTQGATASDLTVLSGDLIKQRSFYLGDQSFTGGYNLASGDLLAFDNFGEIVTATYSGARSRINIFSPGEAWKQTATVKSFTPYGWSRFGVNVGVGHLE